MPVEHYTASERRKDYALIAVGGAALLGAMWLFGDDEDEVAAGDFRDLWELMDPGALNEALTTGAVRQADVQRVIDSGRAVNIRAAIQLLVDAPGVVDDNERGVIAACMRPSYPELLLFTAMFNDTELMSPGAFILTFMDPDGDTDALAQITRHVVALRRRYAGG